jgi:cellulose synthase/poly-beta-1,6-N-acetylglucosamine synthase-like glycosyltransferase
VDYDNTRRVLAVIPAHGEGAQIGEALASLRRQSRVPDGVVVVADNCTDRTAEIARAAGAGVFVTEGNRDKKAGALNQALDALLPELRDEDAVLVMDADSILESTFVAAALERLTERAGGVGGVFTGRDGGGFVGMLQRNEYARYARDVSRLGGKVLVLTGTATLFSVRTLRHVIRARESGELPGAPAIYDTRVLTEDNELTLALLHLGYEVVSPPGCRLTTEVMETWGDLYRQRLRWKRGALENLHDYGLTRVTLPYWARQVWTFLGVAVTATYLATLGWSLLALGHVSLHPICDGDLQPGADGDRPEPRPRPDAARECALRRDGIRRLPAGRARESAARQPRRTREEVVMYHNGILGAGIGIGAGAGAVTLPFTGLNVVWVVLGAFALAMAAGALLRTLPKKVEAR